MSRPRTRSGPQARQRNPSRGRPGLGRPGLGRAGVVNPAAIVLAVILGLLVLRGWVMRDHGAITIGSPAAGLDHITWTGTVAADGRLSVRIDYAFSDEESRDFDIRVPDGARYLALDGRPIAADTGKYASARVQGNAVISYELPGRVTRYRGGALVQLAGEYVSGDGVRLNGDDAMFACPRCYLDPIGFGDTVLYGALYAPGAGRGELMFAGLDPVRGQPSGGHGTGNAVTDPNDVLLFVGNDRSTEDVSMLATLPSSAVPDLPQRDGDVAEALAEIRARYPSKDDTFRAAKPPPGSPGSGPALVLTLLYGGLALVILVRWMWIGGTERAAERATGRLGVSTEVPRPSGRSVTPGELEPALAGLVVGDNGPGRRSVVAATILELARRNVISITGSDSRRVVVTVPAGATGATNFERAVITQMRPLGIDPDPPKETVLTGPPLWQQRAPAVTRALQKVLIREGKRQSLIRVNRALVLAGPVSIAMGIVAIVWIDGVTIHAWIAIVCGPLLALVATRRSGVSLTATGKQQRAEWTAYAEWLRSDPELADADPTSIDRLGEPLAYAAALGAAPTVADVLSPTTPVGR